MRYSVGSVRRWVWRLRARLAAMSDARRAIPAEDAAQAAPFVYEVRHDTQRSAEALAARWAARDLRLRSRCEAARTLRGQALQQLATAQREEAVVEAARSAVGLPPADPENPLGDSLPTWGYLLALAVLTGMEIPLVYMAFSAFGLPPLLTMLLSALSAVIIGFFGHALGSVARHLRLRSSTLLYSLLILALGFAVALAWLREDALKLIRSDLAVLDPVAAALALFVISVASLTVAALLAWHHWTHPLDRARTRARRAQEAARRVVGRLNGEVQRWANLGRAEKRAARQGVLALECEMLQAMAVYAAVNLRWRDGHALPAALHDDRLPRLQSPPALARDEDPDWTTREE